MYKLQQGIVWIISKNKKRAWEDEQAWKMTTNDNKIYNDRHASKNHKEVKNNFEETLKNSYIEYGTLDLNLLSIINSCRRPSNWMGWPL